MEVMISHHLFYQLTRLMETFLVLPPTFKAGLQPILKMRFAKKGEYLLRIGEHQDNVWFLYNGCAQENTINPETGLKEPTWFWFKNCFVFTTPGFFSRQPSESEIQALEDSILIYIDRETFDRFKADFEQCEPLSEMIRDKDLIKRKRHGFDVAKLTAEEILYPFYKKRKFLFNQAKKKDIAAFLGMDYDTMRRLLKEMM